MKELMQAVKNIISEDSGSFYIFDIGALYRWYDTLHQKLEQFSGRANLVYAIKANPFLTPYMNDKVGKFEVCSPGEFEICMEHHIPTEKIVFSGVYKSKENIGRIFDCGFNGIVTLESISHYELLKEVISEKNIQEVTILPRLSSGNKFGMDEDTILDIIKDASSDKRFIINGIQFFSGTQKKKIKVITEELAYIDTFLERIKTETGTQICNVEYGPGFFYDYYSDNDQLTAFSDVLNEIAHYIDKYTFELEAGRFLSAGCGNYVTTIVDVKKTFDKNYILVNGGIHQVNYYGRMLGMNVPKVCHLKVDGSEIYLSNEDNMDEYEVAGALCTVNDVLLKNYKLSEPRIGDLLVFKDTGAYSCTESSVLFLSRDIPRIYVLTPNGEIVKLREKIESYTMNSGRHV